MKLAPSILAADYSKLGQDISEVDKAGCDLIHIDVMDGHFVPNITFGPDMVKSIRGVTSLPLDVHLMIERPEMFVDVFLDSGADIITVHLECITDFNRILTAVKSKNCKLGISIKPNTDYKKIEKYIKLIDMVLVMSVEPGFGGQDFIKESLNKIRGIRELSKDIDIEVDGGINLENVASVVNAGANIIVAGSSVFKSDDIAKAVREFKRLGK